METMTIRWQVVQPGDVLAVPNTPSVKAVEHRQDGKVRATVAYAAGNHVQLVRWLTESVDVVVSHPSGRPQTPDSLLHLRYNRK